MAPPGRSAGHGRQRRKPSGGKGREKHLGHTPADAVENAPRNAAKGSLPRRAGSCVRSACAKRFSSCSELCASSCAKRVSSCSAAVCGDQPHFSGSVFLCSSNRSLPERAAGQKPCLGGFDAQCGHGLLPPKGAGCLCAADTLHHDLLSLHPLSVIIFNAFFGVESKITEIAA